MKEIQREEEEICVREVKVIFFDCDGVVVRVPRGELSGYRLQ